MQPINDSLFLLHARPKHALAMPDAELLVLLCAALVVILDETGADEEDVADLDVAACGGGADVDALGFSTGSEVVVGDRVWRCRVVNDALRGGVGAIVEEDGTAGEAVGRPVVDAAFMVGIRAQNVRGFGSVVEGFGWEVGHVPEAVPLGTALSLRRVSGGKL